MGALLQPIKVCYGSKMTHTGVLVLIYLLGLRMLVLLIIEAGEIIVDVARI